MTKELTVIPGRGKGKTGKEGEGPTVKGKLLDRLKVYKLNFFMHQ